MRGYSTLRQEIMGIVIQMETGRAGTEEVGVGEVSMEEGEVITMEEEEVITITVGEEGIIMVAVGVAVAEEAGVVEVGVRMAEASRTGTTTVRGKELHEIEVALMNYGQKSIPLT